jgi:hypothetical protein
MRTSGVIGYAEQRKVRPGVWEDVIVEKRFRGDVLRPSSGIEENGKVNDDLKVSNSLSIVATAYHSAHVFDIRYISWQGKLWKVSRVDVLPPRINVQLGGLYLGAKAETPGSTGGDPGQ